MWSLCGVEDSVNFLYIGKHTPMEMSRRNDFSLSFSFEDKSRDRDGCLCGREAAAQRTAYDEQADLCCLHTNKYPNFIAATPFCWVWCLLQLSFPVKHLLEASIEAPSSELLQARRVCSPNCPQLGASEVWTPLLSWQWSWVSVRAWEPRGAMGL